MWTSGTQNYFQVKHWWIHSYELKVLPSKSLMSHGIQSSLQHVTWIKANDKMLLSLNHSPDTTSILT